MKFKNNFILLEVLLIAQFALLEAATSTSSLAKEKSKPPKSDLIVPYLVALTVGDVFTGIRSLLCGGALVSSKTVLTTAYCINSVYDSQASPVSLLSSLRATVGSSRWSTGQYTYSFSNKVTHPELKGTRNDIGLLFTNECVQLSKLIQPVALDFEYVWPEVNTKLSKWGSTTVSKTLLGGEKVSDDVVQVTGKSLDEYTCLNKAGAPAFNGTFLDYSTQLCTEHSETCLGLQGSPLIRTDTGALIGIVSGGFACASGGPDIFARLSAFQEFINQNIIKDC